MNCKQGDLAIVVHSVSNNHGKIVRCVAFSPAHPYLDATEHDSWEIDPPLPSYMGAYATHMPDAWLKPLPPLDDSDDVVETKELEYHD